jgi:hypothetical protein
MNLRDSAIRPWSVPVLVADIPETGMRINPKPDEAARSAIAKAAGLIDLPRLECAFDLSHYGNGGVHVLGWVSATVGQTCVVTLEPMQNEVEEDIDLIFTTAAGASVAVGGGSVPASDDAPEPLQNGIVDVGAIATEFLMLGIDPYPRRPGAELELPKNADEPGDRPFSALAALKKPGTG